MLEKYSGGAVLLRPSPRPTIRRRIEGRQGKHGLSLISADYLGFVPKKICD